ncbi:MAG TPA: hypothetical protein VMR50_00825 [Myxococcota bacterium]|nr:hypothetical protein [Myxococcota bacterium]
MRPIVPFLAAFLLGCETVCSAEFPVQPDHAILSSTPIVHCLRSLGFDDGPDDTLTARMADDPTLVAEASIEPGAAATVHRLPDRWSVSFTAGHSAAADSSYFAGAFARCISVHDPNAPVQVRSARLPG